MKYFTICTKKEYEEDGEQKAKWYTVGILKFTKNGGKYLRMFHLPNTSFHVFEQEHGSEESLSTIE